MHPSFRCSDALLTILMVSALASSAVAQLPSAGQAAQGAQRPPVTEEQVRRGRQLVLTHACGGCHSPVADPAADWWLAGMRSPIQEFYIGPCAVSPGATPCFRTRARNITPDNATGLGRFSERQIFNALRYGLRPGETPDVTITSSEPGKGNFPASPKYLAPPMPWPNWRHMSDQQIWDIAAYLKHGVKPVSNKVADSEGPPDFWASEYTVAKIGQYPAPAFPTANEKRP
jgi:mono/diheme cytochrome c family protein